MAQVKEFLCVSRNGELMVLSVQAATDPFLDLLNELTERGYQYQVIDKPAYYYLRDVKGVKGYTVK